MNVLRRTLVRMLPRNSEIAFRIGRKLVNLYHGDNDFDFETNGELTVARVLLPHSRVVFDVGANVGDWVAMAVGIQPDAQYHCFEPSGATFRRLSQRELPPNVQRNHFGLGSRSEERTLFLFGEAVGSNSLYARVGGEDHQLTQETVALRTLDEYCAANAIAEIDFVKIDVEGHELSVLQGASRMLSRGAIGVVQFEYGGTYIDARVLLKDVWELIGSSGGQYSFYKIYPDRPRRVPEYRQTLETYQYSNWLIVRSDWTGRMGGRQ
jgi:FkbM family methyltransferase